MTTPVRACGLAALLTAVALTGCAPKRLTLPTGSGTPVADFLTPFEQASAGCRGVRTLTAEIRLSGRAGRARMRGTLLAGFDRPDRLRLEAVAPFGPPVFILVARDGKATLWLERAGRFVSGVSAADILEALTGVRLDPAVLRAMIAGCVVPDPQPSNGRSFANGWLGVDLAPDASAYLKRDGGQWRIVAGQVSGFEVGYRQLESGRPQAVTLQSTSEVDDRPAVNMALTLAQVNVNTDLKPNVFEVNVPPGASSMTVEELRVEGPLGQKQKEEGRRKKEEGKTDTKDEG